MNENDILTDNIIGCDLKNRFWSVRTHDPCLVNENSIPSQASMLAHWQIFSKIFKKDFELM